jgi:murein DD-endopeptidase MepM/ murein hydrolase activator NlpD
MGIGRSRFAWFAALAVLAVVLGIGGGYLASKGPAPTESPGPVTAARTQAPAPTGAPGRPASNGPTPERSTERSPGLAARATPSPSGSTLGASTPAAPSPLGPTTTTAAATPSAAPASAAGFDPRHTPVPMAFPLPARAKYVYGPAWRTPRLGIVYPYNQIRGVDRNGTLLRAHDGVDLQVPIGTTVMAPFAGTIVNPAALWKPWDPERYGNVVVVRSSEATSKGYYAILVHLSSKSVKVGDRVTRGQVVGRTGITGNAEGTIPHLHFELRAPFQITFHYAGVTRLLDDFDPLPSLQAADPRRH